MEYASATGTFSVPIIKQRAGTILLVTATDSSNNVSSVAKVIVKIK
ncbi:Ig-like domain-containing protein [Alicyclobacillus pomorum]